MCVYICLYTKALAADRAKGLELLLALALAVQAPPQPDAGVPFILTIWARATSTVLAWICRLYWGGRHFCAKDPH